MGRVIKTIEIEGNPVVALFHTGAFHSYVLKKHLKGIPSRAVKRPYEVSLGGQTIVVRQYSVINGKIEGLDFATTLVPVRSLGKADGQQLDCILGAGTMEEWEITVDAKHGTLGLEGLKRREFTEY